MKIFKNKPNRPIEVRYSVKMTPGNSTIRRWDLGNTLSAKIFALCSNTLATHSLKVNDTEIVMIGLDDIYNGIFSIEHNQTDIIEWLKDSTQAPCSVVLERMPTANRDIEECWVHFSSKSDAALFKMAFV